MGETKELIQMKPGEHGVVREIHGDRELTQRMMVLGLRPGSRLVVLNNPRNGPLLLQVGDTRLAIGRGEAGGVMIAEGDEEDTDE